MDLSILDWFVVIVVLLVLVVLLDGYRRAQRSRRNQVRLSKNAKRMAKMGAAEPDEDVSTTTASSSMVSEPRVLGEPSIPDSFGSALDEHDMSQGDGGIESCPFMSGQLDEASTSQSQASAPEQAMSTTEAIESQTASSDVDESRLDDDGLSAPGPIAANLSGDDALDPLFVDPIKASANPSDSKTQKTSREEFQPSLFDQQLEQEPQPKSVVQEPEEIIVLHVMATQEEGFAGEDLSHILLACDCRFGDMNIFHRYEGGHESGIAQFSIVNRVKPGTFDMGNINSFSTPGVSFFIQLPGPVEPMKAFDDMVDTAKCLVRNLSGELKDELGSAVTEQTLAHSRERIRQYQQKRLVSSS